MSFSFTYSVYPQDGGEPRLGTLTTPHGEIQTPAFIFCATKAAVKGLTMEDMESAQTQIILANTYHLMLVPGAERVQQLGGLNHMMGWQGPTLTDSGGYQIFSMGYGSVAEEIKGNRKFAQAKALVKITEEGARFKSYWDGATIMLTPERSMEIQEKIGADLIVAFDECTPYHVDRAYTAMSMRRSHRWEERSLIHFQKLESEKSEGVLPQALYGVVQGGVYPDLRTESCDFLNNHAFFGQAIGGCLGATKEQMQDVVAWTRKQLRPDRPVHLLGIGKVADIFHGVRLGIDTFDCVHPTRIARHGCALVRPQENPTWQQKEGEHMNLKNAYFADKTDPISPTCGCLTCQKYSCGYIHHLLKSKEMVAAILIARHNVFFMNALMHAIREGIAENRLGEVEHEWSQR